MLCVFFKHFFEKTSYDFHSSCRSSASEVFDYLDDKEIFAEATEDVQAHQLGIPLKTAKNR